MGPLICRMKRSHGTKYTELDEKRRSGSLERKDISFLNGVISLVFLPLCVSRLLSSVDTVLEFNGIRADFRVAG